MTTIKTQRKNTIGDAMRAKILAAGQTPFGFSIDGHISAQYHCNLLMSDGLLFRAWVNLKLVRYFTTPEAVASFLAANPWTDSRPNRDRNGTGTPRVRLDKPAAKPTFAEQQFIQRTAKVSAPLAKPCKVAAEPIHTAQTRYSSRMMTDRHAVSIPFKRIGQPGFSMSVGGTA